MLKLSMHLGVQRLCLQLFMISWINWNIIHSGLPPVEIWCLCLLMVSLTKLNMIHHNRQASVCSFSSFSHSANYRLDHWYLFGPFYALTTSSGLFTEEEMRCHGWSVTYLLSHCEIKTMIQSNIPWGFAVDILEQGFNGRVVPQIEIDNVTDSG